VARGACRGRAAPTSCERGLHALRLAHALPVTTALALFALVHSARNISAALKAQRQRRRRHRHAMRARGSTSAFALCAWLRLAMPSAYSRLANSNAFRAYLSLRVALLRTLLALLRASAAHAVW